MATASHFRYKPKSPAKVCAWVCFPTTHQKLATSMLWTHGQNFQASPSICTSTELSGRINTPYLTVFFGWHHSFGFCTSTGFVVKKTWILHVCIDLCIEDKVIPQGKNKDSNHQIEPFTFLFLVDRIFWEEECVYIYILNFIILFCGS